MSTVSDCFVCVFAGELFEYLRNRQLPVYGPLVILRCLRDKRPLPLAPKPVFSQAMKDVVVTFSSVAPEGRTRLAQRVEFMGGRVEAPLNISVTHVICGEFRRILSNSRRFSDFILRVIAVDYSEFHRRCVLTSEVHPATIQSLPIPNRASRLISRRGWLEKIYRRILERARTSDHSMDRRCVGSSSARIEACNFSGGRVQDSNFRQPCHHLVGA